ncbi:TetR/AcrR family transcriptional regulator [Planctomonas sp. JC2975]|nr:TetR/AcrR family transcriptional regulator [Planctomonas sp. JC2975]NNC13503.1 TetR/AcrR family transcriptional regulator [Planctomonas sp. JC2975]
MPKVSDEHREARRQQILDAAVRSFLRRGFKESSMSDIIAESGLSAGAIYGHFSGKGEIVAAVTDRVLEAGPEALRNARDPHGVPLHPLDALNGLLDAIVEQVGGTTMPLQVWGQAAVDPELRQSFQRVFPQLMSAIAEQYALWLREVRGMSDAAAATRATELAPLLIGLLQGAVVQGTLIDGFDRPGYFALARPLFDEA